MPQKSKNINNHRSQIPHLIIRNIIFEYTNNVIHFFRFWNALKTYAHIKFQGGPKTISSYTNIIETYSLHLSVANATTPVTVDYLFTHLNIFVP